MKASREVTALLHAVASGQCSRSELARWLAERSLSFLESENLPDRIIVADLDAALGEVQRGAKGETFLAGTAKKLIPRLGLSPARGEPRQLPTEARAMPIYERPLVDLLEDCIQEFGRPVTREEIVDWFQTRYPKFKRASVIIYITSCSVNDRGRRHYSHKRDILFRQLDGTYIPYDSAVHGHYTPEGVRLEDVEADENEEDELALSRNPEFALERSLEEFIYDNWMRIDFGAPLRLFRDEHGQEGRQWDTGEIGRIDFLCVDDRDGTFTIIELKKGRPSDKVIGQLQRYMGWVSENLANSAPVRGIIITPSVDDLNLKYALKAAKNIAWKQYEVTFRLQAAE